MLKTFRDELATLESKVAQHFSELLTKQSEFIIFSEEDLEHDIPDDYLECRNDITGNVFDVHPLRVNNNGILVVEADGGSTMHLIRLSDLSNITDQIILCELMEEKMN